MAKIMMRDLTPTLSIEEENELEALDSREIVYDEECPEMTPDQLSQFHRFDQVSVSISDADMKKILSLNGEPRVILSKLITFAINDTELLHKCI